jgi:hypothetical protein
MALRSKQSPFPDSVEFVEAIEGASVAADPDQPMIETVIRRGTVWKASHDLVRRYPEVLRAAG